jgi:hypothetical protein
MKTEYVRASLLASLVLGAVGGLATGCGSTDSVADPAAAGPSPGTSPQLGAGGASGADAGPRPTATSFCDGSGGILLPGTTQCTGDLAKKLFRFGMCSCSGITVNGTAKTRSFDSSTSQTLATGGSIGTNGDFRLNGDADIGGSIWTPAITGVSGGGAIAQELRSGKGAAVAGSLSIGGDYYSSQPISGAASVKGVSHVPAAVAPPCDCTEQVPIAAYVAAFATDNDDAASGLTPQSLGASAVDANLTLGCGRYYFDEIAARSSVTITLKGRTAIFVAGDVVTNGGLSFVFEKGAELDLFVTGNFQINGSAVFGNTDAPARARLYVAGTQLLANGDSRIAANVYAPNATIGLNGGHTTRGSIYARGVSLNGDLDLEYDEAILKVQGCEAPGTSCKSCGDCGGATPACNGGACGACKTNADCCAPLTCAADGSCVAVVR